MYYSDENDYDFDLEDDVQESNYLIDNDNSFNKTIEIINFYKDKLIKEPTFIGINRLCAYELYSIINSCNDKKISKKSHISFDEEIIFYDLLNELNIKNITTNLINNISNEIYYKLYV